MMVKGTYGIETEVVLSLLCVLNAWGLLTSVINQKLNTDEVAQFKKSMSCGTSRGPKRPLTSGF